MRIAYGPNLWKFLVAKISCSTVIELNFLDNINYSDWVPYATNMAEDLYSVSLFVVIYTVIIKARCECKKLYQYNDLYAAIYYIPEYMYLI